MYTTSVIGLLIFPVGFLFILQFGLNLKKINFFSVGILWPES